MLILANIGIPMILFEVFWMPIVLIPVIFVEYIVAKNILNLSNSKIIKGTTFANILSTFVGIPLSWFLMVMIQFATTGGGVIPYLNIDRPLQGIAYVALTSAWLLPFERHIHWMIPLAQAFLLIPAYILSVLIEGLILKMYWKEFNAKEIFKTTCKMNAASYGLLILITFLWFIYETLKGWSL